MRWNLSSVDQSWYSRSKSSGWIGYAALIRSSYDGSATPLGRDFYVQSAFVPTDPFFGSFALETTAYARVSDWPTSVVGIHGTNQPEFLGEAVSHGCVRVANDVAARLRRLAPLGTPIDIVRR